MTKVVYFTAATLDGYIADEHNSLDWLFEVPHPDEDDGAWEALMARTGALVLGATTYQWMVDRHPELLSGPDQWHEFYGERPAWVFTHRSDLPVVRGTRISFVSGDVRPVYDEIAANIDLRRLPVPDEIADAVVFMCSDLSRGITGHCLDVNCGEYHH